MKTLFDETQIATSLSQLGPKIVAELGAHFVMVPILTGGFVFAADVARAVYRAGGNPEIDFLQLASYGDARQSSGQVELIKDVSIPVAGETVLLVDDVLDTGRSLAMARALFDERGAARVATCVAVEKPVAKRETELHADFPLFMLDADEFLVGYGLDDAGLHRASPSIMAIET